MTRKPDKDLIRERLGLPLDATDGDVRRVIDEKIGTGAYSPDLSAIRATFGFGDEMTAENWMSLIRDKITALSQHPNFIIGWEDGVLSIRPRKRKVMLHLYWREAIDDQGNMGNRHYIEHLADKGTINAQIGELASKIELLISPRKLVVGGVERNVIDKGLVADDPNKSAEVLV